MRPKMKWEAIRKQGQRTDLTSSQPATKYRSDERIANEFGIGKDTLHRYIPSDLLNSRTAFHGRRGQDRPHACGGIVVFDGTGTAFF